MMQRFSKPPPSATRPPLRVLKPLENQSFPVNSQNAVGAVGAVNSGSRRYKKANSPFTLGSLWLGPTIIIAWALLAIIIATQIAQFDRRAPHYRPFLCHPGDTRTTNHTPACGGRQ